MSDTMRMLPAAGDPLVQVGLLGPDGRLFPVARIDDGVFRESEEPIANAGDDGGEVAGAGLRVARPAGEQRVAAEQERADGEARAPWRMAGRLDGPHGGHTEAELLSVDDGKVGRRFEHALVGLADTGRRLDAGLEGIQLVVVIAMAVRDQDRLDACVGDGAGDGVRLPAGVDHVALTTVRITDHVDDVLEGPNRQHAQLEVRAAASYALPIGHGNPPRSTFQRYASCVEHSSRNWAR